jgi:kynurenine formamidase
MSPDANLEGLKAPEARAARLVDLSHTVEHGLVTYRGLPAPVICDFLSREASRQVYAAGTEFHIGKIEMVANTGTYVDAPYHRFAGGKDLADLPLTSLAELPAVVIRPDLRLLAGGGDGRRHAAGRAIDARALGRPEVAGRAVLVETGWSRHWATEAYFEGHPFLTADAARYLRDEGAVLVGIDSLNIDSTDDGERPVHTTLLGADIPVCEHLRGLDQLPAAGFRFSAVPVKVRAFGTFPVRAYAALPG